MIYLVQPERLFCGVLFLKGVWPVAFEIQYIHHDQPRKGIYRALIQQVEDFTLSQKEWKK